MKTGERETELRRSEERLRSLLRAAPAGIGLVVDRVLLEVNDRLSEMTGYAPDELVGRSARLLYPSDEDFEYVGSEKYRQIQDRGTGTVETRWRRKDGRVIDVLLSSTPLDPEDLGRGVTFTALEITDRKRTEESLRQGEALLRRSQQIAHLGSWEYLLASNRLTWSDEVYRIFGLDPGSFRPTYEAFMAAVHPEDREAVDAAYTRSVREGAQGYEIQHRIVRRDGGEERVVLDCCEHERNDAGDVVRSVGFVQDITERIRVEAENLRLEAQLRHSQKMEAVGRLAGGVSHDFNNMLCAIKGNVSLALADLPVGHPVREWVEQIGEAADHAAALTSQLLTFSRKQVIRPRVIDLVERVDLLRPMLARMIREDIRLECVAHAEVVGVLLDPVQLEQVLLNLAVNARDAMPGGGELWIESAVVKEGGTPRTRVEAKAGGTHAELIVSDTGCGMATEVRERIFEPFFTTKESGCGTGLGLSTVFGIVEQNGGSIEIRSAPGRGSRFRILLPLVEGEPARAEPVVAGGGEQETGTVLVVEDQEIVRRSTVRLLEKVGYQVLLAGSGEEALELAGRHPGPIDVLLTDMVMPGMSGRELVRRFRERWPATRVLLTSGYTEEQGGAGPGSDRTEAYLAKPYTFEDLVECLRRLRGPPMGAGPHPGSQP